MKRYLLILIVLSLYSVDVFSMCAPPANELCGGATAIAVGGCTGAGNSGCDVTGDPGGVSCGPAADGSSWYSFVAPASGNVDVTATLTGGYYSAIVLYSGACGSQVEQGCYYPAPLANPYTGSFTGLTPGATYYVVLNSPSSGTGQTSYSSICVTDAGGGGGGGPVDCLNNDACSSPETLTLNASGGGPACVTDCNTGSNVGPNFAGNNCYDLPNGTVWFSITTDALAATLDVTVTSGTMGANPEFTVFTNACGPYTVVSCDEGTGGTSSTTGIPVAASTTYLIAVSNWAGSAGTFDLCVAQEPDNSACNTNNSFTMTSSSLGSPQGGPYQCGEVVEFCYTVTDWQQVNCNYIGAFVPEFGNCWDPASFDANGQPVNITTALNVNGVIQACPPGPPCQWSGCVGQPSGSWQWFPAGTVTYNINGYYPAGTAMPGGWYFISNYDPATGNCTPTPTDPDFTYGDGNFPACGTNTFDYTICFTLTAGCDPDSNNCMVGMKTFADGEFGAWNNIGCIVDIQSVISGTLPIELLSFDAALIDNTAVKLHWSTASEINNDFFTIERSKDGKTFEVVGIVDGAGNSTMVKNYSLEDSNPYMGTSYYRLKQTDFDGASSYSDIKSVTVVSDFGGVVLLPNPVTGQGKLTFTAQRENDYKIVVLDVTGRVVLSQKGISTKGQNNIVLETKELNQGMYFLSLDNGRETVTTKFIKE